MNSAVAPDLIVSHYRVTGRIGAGGMGEVYAGVDETLRRRVALKAIQPERRLEPEAKARFLREARILSQLDHPHICRVYDYIETPDRDWLVLELIEGETLGKALRQGLRHEDKLRIAEQIAAVLVATHAAGVVHRDLKPGNVMLTRSGDVKVLDFGLSATVPGGALISDDAHLTSDAGAVSDTAETMLPRATGATAPLVDVSLFHSHAGGIKGTVGYMSPEQARGEIATTASDMYSFGLVLQELFTGRMPYDESSDYFDALGKAQRAETLAPVGVSSDLAALLRRLKALGPAERPTAIDTAERLRWIRDTPRRRLRHLAVAGVVAAAGLGAAKYTYDLSRERTAAVVAREEADRRRDQAEGLIGFMLGDLRLKLTAVGRLEILDEIGKRALDYFAAVPSDALSGEELFRRSQAMHQLGQVRQARADFEGAANAYDESLAQASDLVTRDPGNAQWQLALGTSHFYVGDLKRRRGDLDGALQHFRAYQAIAQRLVQQDANNTEWLLELSYGHSNVAAILQQQGDLRGATDRLELTGRIHEQLLQRNPADRVLLADRANNFNRLGIVLDRVGELTLALDRFERELALHTTMLAADPRDTRVARRAAICRLYMGLTLRAVGRTEESLRQLRQSHADAGHLVTIDKTNADWQRDQAIAALWVARSLVERGEPGPAMPLIEASLATLEPPAQRANASATARLDLARGREVLAAARLATRQYQETVRDTGLALALLEPLLAVNAVRVEAAVVAASAENLRGQAWAALADATAAASAWKRSVDLVQPLAAGGQDRHPLEPLVRALVYLGRVEEARPWFEKLTRLGYREPTLVALWNARSAMRLSPATSTE